MTDAPWIITIPGIALMITVMGLNMLGDGLRDVLDPRLQDSAMSLLEVRGLTTAFATERGEVVAVEDVELRRQRRRNPRHRRRIRLRQKRHGADDHGPAAAPAGAHQSGHGALRRAGTDAAFRAAPGTASAAPAFP